MTWDRRRKLQNPERVDARANDPQPGRAFPFGLGRPAFAAPPLRATSARARPVVPKPTLPGARGHVTAETQLADRIARDRVHAPAVRESTSRHRSPAFCRNAAGVRWWSRCGGPGPPVVQPARSTREAARSAACRTFADARALTAIVPAPHIAGLALAILPLTPGFSPTGTGAAVVAAVVAAALAIGILFVGSGIERLAWPIWVLCRLC